MKYALFVIAIFYLFSCERSFDSSKTAKVSFALPSLSMKSEAQTSDFNSSLNPSSVDDFNCYGLFVTGPELELRRNVCGRKSDSSFPKKTVGLIAGGVAMGSTLNLTVPAGNDRVFTLVGFKTQDNYCPQFISEKIDESKMSKPHYIGEVGRVSLNPGENKTLQIQMKYDSTAWFDDCQGPDFNLDSSGGGGSSTDLVQVDIPTQNPSLLAVQAKFKTDHASKYTCLPYEALFLKNEAGSLSKPVKLPQALTLQIQLSTTSGPKELFEDELCSSAITPISGSFYLSAPAGEYRKKFYIVTQTGETINIQSQLTGGGTTLTAASQALTATNDVSIYSPNVLKVHNIDFVYGADQKSAALPMGVFTCREVQVYTYYSNNSSLFGITKNSTALTGINLKVISGRNVISSSCEDSSSTNELNLSMATQVGFVKFAIRRFADSAFGEQAHIQVNYLGAEYPAIQTNNSIFAKDIFIQY